MQLKMWKHFTPEIILRLLFLFKNVFKFLFFFFFWEITAVISVLIMNIEVCLHKLV